MWKKNNDSIKWLALPLSPSNSRLIQFLKLISCLMWLELRGKWLLFRICIVFFFLFTCIIFIFFIFICFIFFINSNINIGTSIGNSTTTSTSNNTCSNSNTSSKANLFPRTSPVLEKKELLDLCAVHHLRPGKLTKEGWVDKILLVTKPQYEKELDLLRSQITSSGFSTCDWQSNIHCMYWKTFNSVDLHDRSYYATRSAFPVRNWRTKMLFGIMTSAFLNSYTIWN